MFWSDCNQKEPKIERSSMDGDPGTRRIIVSNRIGCPAGMSIDYTENRLYWSDVDKGQITSAAFDGESRRDVACKQPMPQLATTFHFKPFSLALDSSTIYWSDLADQSRDIYSCDRNTSQVLAANVHQPYGISLVMGDDPATRKSSSNNSQPACSNCSQLCLLAPQPKNFSCVDSGPINNKPTTQSKVTQSGPNEWMLLLARRTDIRLIKVDDHRVVTLRKGFPKVFLTVKGKF